MYGPVITPFNKGSLMICYDSPIEMQLEWELELKVKCLDSRSSKQHVCNDKHDKLLHANETYQLKVVLYADITLTNHKFLGVCSEGKQGGPSHKVRGGAMLARQDNGHQWRAESMQGEGRGLGLQRGPRVRGLNAKRKGRGLCKEEGRGYKEGAEGFNDSPKKRPRIRKGGPRA